MSPNLLRMFSGILGSQSANSRVQPQPKSRPQLLVVDDDCGIRRLVSRAVEACNAQCLEAGSLEEMALVLKHESPGLLLLDLSLDRSDAYDALAVLKRKEFKGSVVLLSGHELGVLEHVRCIGESYGLNMLQPIRKPVRVDALRELVRSMFPVEEAPIHFDFQTALRNNQLEVWYQPKISLEHFGTVGFEALARIRHPQRGIILPSQFIGELSDGDMAVLTERVLKQTVHDWSCLARDGLVLRPSINVRARDLANAGLIDLLRCCRPDDPNWPGLMLELDEPSLPEDEPKVRDAIMRLRLHKVEFALDDFARFLHHPAPSFQLSEINVSHRFVDGCASDPQKLAVCKAAVQVARQLKVRCAAVGLETTADMLAVKEAGFDLAQGNLFSPAVPMATLQEMRYAILYQEAPQKLYAAG
jgi:EAL domain-containing protein (putative c-di-GMP-specific phosphodiesterase class I)